VSKSEQVQNILAGASVLPPDQRAAYLDAACGKDVALRAEVASLLRSLDEAGSFLSAPTADASEARTANSSAATVDELSREHAGQMIGRYKLLQPIGEGGFGSVWMAEQREPVKRLVALKIIKLGMDTRQVVARFEQERQALAMMDHPNIARVLDAGATEVGRPYFVMDLVKGDPIATYCDKNNLSIEDRLNLFRQVCEAVQHAHTKGIIHRDIKPSNVLVSTQDGKPSAKVIDFGIAKATQNNLTDKTFYTEYQQLIGTPEYMSPEQAEGSLDIDTRTDVYSLGVMLYQLLTGSTPFDGKELRSAAYGEIQRIIREVDPPKPSTRISESADTIASVAAKRQTEPKRLGAFVRGELDWIVMKAMEKDRSRRYETANGLAMDIQRFLSGEAVVAAPVSRAYQLRKFIRRNKGTVTAAVLIATAILVGAAASTAGFIHARRQRDVAIAAETRARSESERATTAEAKAVAEAQSATTISDFLASMLGGVGPEVALGRDTALLRSILEKTEDRVGKELADQPLVAGRMLRIVADVYNQLAAIDKADANARRALELIKSAPGDNRVEIARATHDLGTALESQGKYTEAKAKFEEAFDLYVAAGAGESGNAVSALSAIGGVLFRTRNFSGAETSFRKVLDARRRLANNEDSANLASSLDRLAVLLSYGKNEYAESETLQREALAMRRRLYGELHPEVALGLSNLAANLGSQGRFDDAIEFNKQSIDQHRKLFGERHPRTAQAMASYAKNLDRSGRPAEAIAMRRLVVEINIESVGAGHRETLDSRFNLGWAMDAAKDYAGAEEQYRAMLEWARINYKSPDHRTAGVIMLVAATVNNQGRHADAEALYREALELFILTRPTGHSSIAEARNALADCLVTQNRPAEAEPLLLAVERDSRLENVPPPDRAAAATRLASFYTDWDKAEPARGYDAKATEWKLKSETTQPATKDQIPGK